MDALAAARAGRAAGSGRCAPDLRCLHAPRIRDGHVPLLRPRVMAMNDSFWRYVSNQVARAEADAPAKITASQGVQTANRP